MKVKDKCMPLVKTDLETNLGRSAAEIRLIE